MSFIFFSYLFLVSAQEVEKGNYIPLLLTMALLLAYKLTKKTTKKMVYGKTDAETAKLNKWKVGTVLISNEGTKLDRIKITSIGLTKVLCLHDPEAKGTWTTESEVSLLRERHWMEE